MFAGKVWIVRRGHLKFAMVKLASVFPANRGLKGLLDTNALAYLTQSQTVGK